MLPPQRMRAVMFVNIPTRHIHMRRYLKETSSPRLWPGFATSSLDFTLFTPNYGRAQSQWQSESLSQWQWGQPQSDSDSASNPLSPYLVPDFGFSKFYWCIVTSTKLCKFYYNNYYTLIVLNCRLNYRAILRYSFCRRRDILDIRHIHIHRRHGRVSKAVGHLAHVWRGTGHNGDKSGTATTKTATRQNGDTPKRRQQWSKRRQLESATTRVKTATTIKSKRRQPLVKTATSIGKNGDKHWSKRRIILVKTATVIDQNGDNWQSNGDTSHVCSRAIPRCVVRDIRQHFLSFLPPKLAILSRFLAVT